MNLQAYFTNISGTDLTGELNNIKKQNKLKNSFVTGFSSPFMTKELTDIRA